MKTAKILLTALSLSFSVPVFAGTTSTNGIIAFKGAVVENPCTFYTKDGNVSTFCGVSGKTSTSVEDAFKFTDLKRIDEKRDLPFKLGTMTMTSVKNMDNGFIATSTYN